MRCLILRRRFSEYQRRTVGEKPHTARILVCGRNDNVNTRSRCAKSCKGDCAGETRKQWDRQIATSLIPEHSTDDGCFGQSTPSFHDPLKYGGCPISNTNAYRWTATVFLARRLNPLDCFFSAFSIPKRKERKLLRSGWSGYMISWSRIFAMQSGSCASLPDSPSPQI